jgi:hypothetical protein
MKFAERHVKNSPVKKDTKNSPVKDDAGVRPLSDLGFRVPVEAGDDPEVDVLVPAARGLEICAKNLKPVKA